MYAIYKSNYFPFNKQVLNNSGDIPDYDILNYFIDKSHKKNIEIHAWINPYRISNDNDISKLDNNTYAYKWLNTNNLSLAAMVDDILNTNSDYFRDYVLKRIESNNMVSELPKAKDKFNELL